MSVEAASKEFTIPTHVLPHIELGPELSIIIPTKNERDNIVPLYERLCVALKSENWEAIFVDDDSDDGTSDEIQKLARVDRRIRLIYRIGRRGLSSACVEGILASVSPFIAVMDADLQHDETLLPQMLNCLRSEPIDVVVGSRYVSGGGIGQWARWRALISGTATKFSRYILKVSISDPMSGFFMLRRDVFRAAMRNLSAIGFKILTDLLVSSPQPLRVKEIPFEFKARHSGESKLDTLVAWEYLLLLADKFAGQFVPIRFVLFSIVGGIGVFTNLALLWLLLKLFELPFTTSQTVATGLTIISNFVLNNWLTYHDQRLKGWSFITGLISFFIICSFGAAANVGIASLLYGQSHVNWWLAGIAGAAMSAVWNYAVSSTITWRKS